MSVCGEQCCCITPAEPNDKGPYIYPQGLRTIAGWGLVAVSAAWLSFVSVDVWSSSDRWQGHTAISVTFPSDVQYVLFPTDDRREPAAVHPSSHTALQGLKHQQPNPNSAENNQATILTDNLSKHVMNIPCLGRSKNHIRIKKRIQTYFWQVRIFYLQPVLFLVSVEHVLCCLRKKWCCMLSYLHQISPQGCTVQNINLKLHNAMSSLFWKYLLLFSL